VALAILGLAIVLAVIPALNNGKALTVLTGSMQPTLNPGDVAVVYAVGGFGEIETGDIVTFLPKPDDPTLVTHRAVGWGMTGEGEKTLITRGDANGADDQPVTEKQVRAKFAYRVPWVGNLLLYSDFGKPFLLIAAALGLIAYCFYAMVTSVARTDRKASGRPSRHWLATAGTASIEPSPDDQTRLRWRPVPPAGEEHPKRR
jgi:signal peptidase